MAKEKNKLEYKETPKKYFLDLSKGIIAVLVSIILVFNVNKCSRDEILVSKLKSVHKTIKKDKASLLVEGMVKAIKSTDRNADFLKFFEYELLYNQLINFDFNGDDLLIDLQTDLINFKVKHQGLRNLMRDLPDEERNKFSSQFLKQLNYEANIIEIYMEYFSGHIAKDEFHTQYKKVTKF